MKRKKTQILLFWMLSQIKVLTKRKQWKVTRQLNRSKEEIKIDSGTKVTAISENFINELEHPSYKSQQFQKKFINELEQPSYSLHQSR